MTDKIVKTFQIIDIPVSKAWAMINAFGKREGCFLGLTEKEYLSLDIDQYAIAYRATFKSGMSFLQDFQGIIQLVEIDPNRTRIEWTTFFKVSYAKAFQAELAINRLFRDSMQCFQQFDLQQAA